MKLSLRRVTFSVLALAGLVAGFGSAAASPGATFASNPVAAPPGATLVVSSITPCPSVGARAPVVIVTLVEGSRLIGTVQLPVSPSGRWRGTLAIARSATPGPASLDASCLSKAPSGPPEGLAALETLTYDLTPFVVTTPSPLRPARPAQAVRAVPLTTG
jgi:hypothetical protein